MDRFVQLSGENYRACDIDPSRYKHPTVRVARFDLCHDLRRLPSASFDLVLHNHVLEHVPKDVATVIRELTRVVAPGGVHMFTVPFRGDHTDEDTTYSVSPEERTKRFAQADHWRIFGRVDFPELLREVLGTEDPVFRLGNHFSAEKLASHGVPVQSRIDGGTVFHYHRRHESSPE